jgi:hypothetical protein
MLRGSRPGERRGGRSRGTPNRRTILRDRILAIGSDHPAATQRAFLRKLLKDRKLPADTRIALAPRCFPPKRTRSCRTGRAGALASTTLAQTALAADDSAGASNDAQTAAAAPATPDWNPKALDALFGVVQDATANLKTRRKAALKIAEFLLPKVGKKPKVIPDEYGFLISPKLASAYLGIRFELRALAREPTRNIPAIAAKIKKLEARSAAILRRLEAPCPSRYGVKQAAQDYDRLIELTLLRGSETGQSEAQRAEEAHLRTRYDLFRDSGPEPIARRRREALEDADRRFRMYRSIGGLPAPPLSRQQRAELKLLRRLSPADPKPRAAQLEDGFDTNRFHPFAYELPAPDGNFYPRHSKLRPAGVAGDLLVQTVDGAPISPLSPCNAPATKPIPSVEPPSCDRLPP